MRNLLLALILIPAAACAAPDADKKEGVTTVHFSETARETVPQDRVKTTLFIQHEADNPRAVQNYINQKMQQALAVADKRQDVKAQTLSYNVYQQTRWPRGDESKERITYWQGQQHLELDAEDPAVLLELAGDLQDIGFAMQGLNFYLSTAKTESYRDKLIQQALGQIKYRAKLIGQTLGTKEVTFSEISFSGNTPQPPVMYRAQGLMKMEAASDMAAPVARAGESEVTITVNATVELSE